MDKNAGELQIEAYNYCQELNSLFGRVKILLEQGGQFGTNDAEQMLSYGEMLVQTIEVFGYERFGKEAAWLSNINETYKQRISELSDGTLIMLLDIMLQITDVVLKEKQGMLKRCSCCGNEVYYLPISSYYEEQMKKYGSKEFINETLNKEEYFCPCCGASDRDRLMVEFLKKLEIDKEYHKESMLQIAPAKPVEKWIYRSAPALKYDSTDLYMRDVTFVSDVQDMYQVKSESYDYIICSHVFEHVEDDRKAMRELYRILKEDGFILFLVPIALNITEIDEEWGLSKEENWRRFGQDDHCRYYSKQGLVERLEEAGFCVHQLGKQYFGEDIFTNCGLLDTSTLYVLTKQKKEITLLVEEKKNKRKSLTKPNPLVSVLMSAYNHEKYVAAAVESVLNQTYGNYEFLVADDASSDNTVQELVRYEDRIDEIHLFDENAVGRLNFLIERAKGKYIAIMNSDDIWEKDKLQMQVEYMENHPECGACFTGAACINESGELVKSPFLQENMTKERWMHYLFKNTNCLAHPSILIHREMYCDLLNSGVPIFRQLPDFWMWIRLLQKQEIHVVEKELIRFLVHEEGDNPNTSANTLENRVRTSWEINYLWYDAIKNMEEEYFREVFLDDMKNKEATGREEICCEKYFILKETVTYLAVAAIFYLYDIGQDREIIRTFQEKYGVTYQKLHEVCSEVMCFQKD